MQQHEGGSRTALRTVGFPLVMLVLVYGVIEVASSLAFAVVSDESFSFAELQRHRAALVQGADSVLPAGGDTPDATLARYVRVQVVHPFVGFVTDPTKHGGRRPVNEYGFFGPHPPFGTSAGSSDTVVVAVTGGSVAAQTVTNAAPVLASALQNIDRFSGKHIVIVSLAMGGMKQPQQLMAVNYMLSLGARLDVVINLDGFNDVVLPVVENARHKTFPFYPRSWKIRLGGLADAELLKAAGRVALVEGVRRRAAGFFSFGPLRYSVTANVVWYLADLRLAARAQELRASIEMPNRETLAGASSYEATGPERVYPSEDARFADLAAYWSRSSILLHELARGRGLLYFHFLQPNQYVPGSKIFTSEERAIAFPGHGYRHAATAGYPYLMAAGKDLRRNGVAYTDLTMMFAGNAEVLYADGCCHFNVRGYELIASEIARVIRQALSDP